MNTNGHKPWRSGPWRRRGPHANHPLEAGMQIRYVDDSVMFHKQQ